MTETRWLTCDDLDTLLAVLGRKPSERKQRLFGCASCRRVWESIPSRHRAAVEVAEQFADGLVGEAKLERHQRAARVAKAGSFARGDVRAAVEACACVTDKLSASATRAWWDVVSIRRWKRAEERGTNPRLPDFSEVMKQAREEELSHQLAIFRDIFGNPFRPVTLDPDWRTTTAMQIARGMYDTRDFAAMPILADALQEAGCENTDILDHCRGDGPHVRGCWVVDMVLGKG